MKELGKIHQSFFEETILQNCGFKRNEVLVGPGFGVDVSVVDLNNNMAMALTSDPLSLVPSLGLEESAWLSVHLMANDMATTGFAPMYGQFVLNLPEHFSDEDFTIYWNYIHQFCKEIGVAITGGHTGFIQNQNSTIAGGGTFIAIAPKDQILTSNKAKPGNVLIATKQCGLTAVSILAKSFPNSVQQKLGKEVYDKACDLFYQTTSLKDALTAKGNAENIGEVTAMHDVTEGGILGAAYELAVASGNGLLLHNNAIPLGHIQQEIGKLFSLDPRYIVGAGSMLICANEESEQNVLNRLKAANIDATVIGKIDEHDLPTPDEKMNLYRLGKKLFTENGYEDIGMDHFALQQDELFKAREEGRLHRNFMGYTTQQTNMLIGLGVSSISDAGIAFAQNFKTIHEYYAAINNGELAITKGYFLSEEDVDFKRYILDVSCNGTTTFKPEHAALLQQYTFPELQKIEADELIEWNEQGLRVTTLGWHFLRNICKAFDLQLLRRETVSDKPLFSKAI